MIRISERSDDRRREDLIELRRRLAQCIAELGRCGNLLFARQDDPTLMRVFRANLSHMRSCAAIHQANWPAVRLGESVADYTRSVMGVREANRAFVSWARSVITELT